jgi:hypothetical protein
MRAGYRMAIVLLTAGGTAAAAATNYFLVAEWPGYERHHDAYVLPLTNAAALAHARELIRRGPAAGDTIVVARIAKGTDGINRNHRQPNSPPWSWHVTGFVAFAPSTVEILDGWPGHVESDVDGWIRNTGGMIGFWTYTVVAELPAPPRIEGMSVAGSRVALALGELTVPFRCRIEAKTNLRAGGWTEADAFEIRGPQTNWSAPRRPDEDRRFFRLRVE